MIQYATPKLLQSKASLLHYLNTYAIVPNIIFKQLKTRTHGSFENIQFLPEIK